MDGKSRHIFGLWRKRAVGGWLSVGCCGGQVELVQLESMIAWCTVQLIE